MADFGNDLRTAYDEGYEAGLQDAKDIVLCKNCFSWKEDDSGCGGFCEKIKTYSSPCDFCSRGERKVNISDSTKNSLKRIGRKAHGEA